MFQELSWWLTAAAAHSGGGRTTVLTGTGEVPCRGGRRWFQEASLGDTEWQRVYWRQDGLTEESLAKDEPCSPPRGPGGAPAFCFPYLPPVQLYGDVFYSQIHLFVFLI